MTRRRLESSFQTHFIGELRKLFPGCWILKNDAGYQQGIPDWLFLYEDFWAMFETKREEPTSELDFEPNQEWFLDEFHDMSFAACVFPENEEEVIHALQQALQSHRKARRPQRKQERLGQLRR